MSENDSWSNRRRRLRNRLSARFAGLGGRARAFTSQPEPRTIGSLDRGRQLVAGDFLFAGYLVEAPDSSIWDLPMPDRSFELELHSFAWLDDLAALGDADARERARAWTHDWVRRFGRGGGPGWVPDLAGRRVTRWINHALMLLNGQDMAGSRAFFRALSRQTTFLARRRGATRIGLPRFEALCGLAHAGLSLQGMERHLEPALKALCRECAIRIDGEGGLPSRNPEELLEVFELLTFTQEALVAADHAVPDALRAAIGRTAPTLRMLRHADGGLARFHGGGRGLDGRLDQALAASGIRHMRHRGLSMGYARLGQGRTTVIVDAAPPPRGEASLDAHASTLAFELTSARRPVIVSCGSGASFGARWRRAGRATPSHSTLAIEGYSSSRLGAPGVFAGRRTELLHDAPRDVTCTRPEGNRTLILSHDGYLATHGLMHHRRLDIAADGRSLAGDDTLAALTPAAERVFDEALARAGIGAGGGAGSGSGGGMGGGFGGGGAGGGVAFQLHFHLHPDVAVALDEDGKSAWLSLKSGEVWTLAQDGAAALTLAPSVYLERGRLAPRASRQVVLEGRATGYATRIVWTLAKASDTPGQMRDVAAPDEEATAPQDL